jgi:hypothetical protein
MEGYEIIKCRPNDQADVSEGHSFRLDSSGFSEHLSFSSLPFYT